MRLQPVCALALGASLLLALCACNKQSKTDGFARVTFDYDTQAGGYMTRAQDDSVVGEITRAIQSLHPQSVRVTARGGGRELAFDTGQAVLMPSGGYTFEGVYEPSDRVDFDGSGHAAFTAPTFVVDDSQQIAEGQTEALLKARYTCVCIVSPAATTARIVVTNGSNHDCPTIQVGEYLYTFLRGAYEGYNMKVTAVSNTDEYEDHTRALTMGASSLGSWYYLAPKGNEVTFGLSLPDWYEGTF